MPNLSLCHVFRDRLGKPKSLGRHKLGNGRVGTIKPLDMELPPSIRSTRPPGPDIFKILDPGPDPIFYFFDQKYVGPYSYTIWLTIGSENPWRSPNG
uniref:Uncharacterized protein n=1 Tax=Romanomermis culicivorax TaxID=13658 RepID=A0A915J0H6_ROMCU